MNQKELQDKLATGVPLAVVEYRNSKCDVVEWRDKESGKMRSFVKLMHSVETATDAFQVSERTDDTFKPDSYKPPFKKGQRVVLLLDHWAETKGVLNVGGSLVALEP